jgi:hypothetical protein
LYLPVRCIFYRQQTVGFCFSIKPAICAFWLEDWDC